MSQSQEIADSDECPLRMGNMGTSTKAISLGVVVPMRLAGGLVAWVDQDDYGIVFQRTWCAVKDRNTTYARSPKTKALASVLMHRLILGITDPRVLVDHRNRNGLNNCRHNLRVCTTSQNAANMRRSLAAKTSRFHGVCKRTGSPKWSAQISEGGKRVRLGQFCSEEDAARAYDAAAVRIYGEFAALNFPQEKADVS